MSGQETQGRRRRLTVTFSRDFVIQLEQLGGALADIAGEELCLGMASGSLRGRSAGCAVDDREALTYAEAGRVGVFDRVADS